MGLQRGRVRLVHDTDTNAYRTKEADSTIFDTGDVSVFLGLAVGKTAHHGHGLAPAGKEVFDQPLPDREPKLRAVLAAEFGTVLVIVDQPASIGALPLTVARDAGCKVAYLPGLAMRRITDLDDESGSMVTVQVPIVPPHD